MPLVPVLTKVVQAVLSLFAKKVVEEVAEKLEEKTVSEEREK